MWSVRAVKDVISTYFFNMVGRARLELATNGLKEVVALRFPIYLLAYFAVKMTVRLSVRLNE